MSNNICYFIITVILDINRKNHLLLEIKRKHFKSRKAHLEHKFGIYAFNSIIGHQVISILELYDFSKTVLNQEDYMLKEILEILK